MVKKAQKFPKLCSELRCLSETFPSLPSLLPLPIISSSSLASQGSQALSVTRRKSILRWGWLGKRTHEWRRRPRVPPPLLPKADHFCCWLGKKQLKSRLLYNSHIFTCFYTFLCFTQHATNEKPSPFSHHNHLRKSIVLIIRFFQIFPTICMSNSVAISF